MAQSQRTVREYIQRGHIDNTLTAMPNATQKLLVAAYCRVSSDDEEQLNSYNTQINHYTEYIKSKPEWEFVGVYADA